MIRLRDCHRDCEWTLSQYGEHAAYCRHRPARYGHVAATPRTYLAVRMSLTFLGLAFLIYVLT